jgi:hypothetical protein
MSFGRGLQIHSDGVRFSAAESLLKKFSARLLIATFPLGAGVPNLPGDTTRTTLYSSTVSPNPEYGGRGKAIFRSRRLCRQETLGVHKALFLWTDDQGLGTGLRIRIGCVARHFHRQLEKSVRVVCCDIHDEAVAFIREKLQIEAVRSSNKPQTLGVHENFDVIFFLSFLSHMPDAT